MTVSVRQAKERKARAMLNAIRRAQGHAELLYLASEVKGGELQDKMRSLVSHLMVCEEEAEEVLHMMLQ